MSKCCVLGVVLFWSVAAIAQQPATQPAATDADNALQVTAEILSLQIVKPVPPEWSKAMTGVRRPANPYGDRSQGGIDMLLAIRVPGRQIVAAGDDALSVTTFIDDKYNDLGRGKRDTRSGYYGSASPTANITEDGQGAVFSVGSDRAPSADASRMLLRGSISLRTSTGQKTSARAKAPLRVGRTVDLQPFPMTIRSVSEYQSRQLQISLSVEGSIERLAAVKFFAADGRELTARLSSRSDPTVQSPTVTPRSPSTLSYVLPELIDDLDVQVVYHEAVENVTLPVEIQADLGVVTVGKPTTRPATAPAAPQDGRRSDANVRTGRQTASRPPVATPIERPATQPDWQTRERIAFPPPPNKLDPTINFATTRPAIPPDGQLAAAAATQATVQGTRTDLIGLSISQTPTEKTTWPIRPDLLFRRMGGGTGVRLLITSEQASLVSLDSRSVQIDRFADDKGAELSTELLQAGDGRIAQYPPPPVFSSDGHQAVLDFVMRDSPSRGATQLALLGRINARLGVEKKIHEEKNVEIKAGTVLRLPTGEITIRTISADDAGFSPSSRVELQMVSKTPLEQIRSIEFFDADGTAVRTQLFRSNTVYPEGSPRPAEVSFRCDLSSDIQRGSVKVTYYEKVEQASVPVRVVGGIGL